MDFAAPLSRVALRYVVGFLIAKGYQISPETATDPDLAQLAYFLIAGGLAMLSEGWWWLARKYGWAQ
ncbi:hypothetical protein GWE18_00440 [Bradyrhizobium sp. CSA112]|uniref:hypothetical protein n=1 Tax=Bradyrhizobium sp. CSA112 TaxID=2699170 RepID=UPI0023AE931A|nr:hypothetical protein [Bradyrhizobium sp. CSA112]MDE5451344.1 hypothetical protein [Bradyrhizobium sp. CSA112]